MGYFPNGTAGEMYDGQFCNRCVHMLPEPDGCPCHSAHLLWNYDECNNKESILHKMIPRDQNGFNERCIFFKEDIPENRYVKEIEGMVYTCKVCGDPCSDICEQCIDILKTDSTKSG